MAISLTSSGLSGMTHRVYGNNSSSFTMDNVSIGGLIFVGYQQGCILPSSGSYYYTLCSRTAGSASGGTNMGSRGYGCLVIIRVS